MTKKALCVGLDEYRVEAVECGGVSDAKAWADMLVGHFQFPSSNVTLLLGKDATKSGVMSALEALVMGAQAGDTIVFANSSHGSYVKDTNGDEADARDEAICPYDCDENLIVDDELRELFSRLADGVYFTVISDSCYSGTVLRGLDETTRRFRTPDDRKPRFISPTLLNRPVVEDDLQAKPEGEDKYPESTMKEILLSASKDKEPSWSAKFNGVRRGVMTYFAIKAITDARYDITYEQLQVRVQQSIEEAGYWQHPQLEGTASNKQKQIFS